MRGSRDETFWPTSRRAFGLTGQGGWEGVWLPSSAKRVCSSPATLRQE
jgi:hypothetical protein